MYLIQLLTVPASSAPGWEWLVGARKSGDGWDRRYRRYSMVKRYENRLWQFRSGITLAPMWQIRGSHLLSRLSVCLSVTVG